MLIFLGWTNYTIIILANDWLKYNKGQYVKHGMILYFISKFLVFESKYSMNILWKIFNTYTE